MRLANSTSPSQPSGPLFTMNRMPPPQGPHAHSPYDTSWRPQYPSTFDPPQTSNPPGYPVIANRELPQLTESPYPRPNGMPPQAPMPSPQDLNPPHNFRTPMNGAHDPSPDYRARMGYPPPDSINNAENMPPSGHLPPAPQFMTPVPQLAGATPPGGYDSAAYQNQAARRGKARATQACDQCRTRKAKCDEGRPNCSHCRENSLQCVYKEVPPHKQEKTTQIVLDKLSATEDRVDRRFDHITDRMGKVEDLLEQLLANSGRQTMPRPVKSSQEPASVSIEREPPLKQEAGSTQTRSAILEPGSQDVGTSKYGQKLGPADLLCDDSTNEAEGELSIPVEHTTAAHKLLMWPSIKKLLFPKEYDENYVMRLEEERGLISIYGQGEISYTADDSQLPADIGFGAMSDGDGAGLDADVDIDKFGHMKLDLSTAQRYYDSYLNNMYLLHPFLEQAELDQKVDRFIRCYCRINKSPSSASHMRPARDGPPPAKRRRSNENLGVRGEFKESVANPERPRVGRNIDNAMVLLCLALGAICEVPSPLPGPIMETRPDYRHQHIPAPLPPPRTNPNVPYAPNGVLSPANSDSAIPMQYSQSLHGLPLQSPNQSFQSSNQSFQSPNQSFQSPGPVPGYDSRKNLSTRSVTAVQDERGNTKNYQVIAGLTMYGYATMILGYLQGGNELEHVQAALLAGLYAGQLAHPFQSHSWISQASRACQVLARPTRYTQLVDGPTMDLYNFAYWTCLQLESDLLAELDIPASGISRSESKMGLPAGKFTISLPNDLSAPPTMMMLFYSAQIHLRKVLNRVHTDLYKVEKAGQTRWSSSVQEALSMNLDLWRTSLPDSMKWRDSDEPAKEINAARMRAKYYGARYIIHRPLLYYALHYGQTGARVGSIGQGSVDSPTSQQMSPSIAHNSRSTNMARMSSDMGPTPAASLENGWNAPKVSMRDLPQKLKKACKICIDSAVLSTEAFDGVGGHRLIVTNIFGTAHAQFGNMLVLSATYMSSLREFVEEETLDRLLKRTIRFLALHENISPTLRADARILTEIYTKIFKKAPDLSTDNMNY